jgi:hypothetical protein
MINGYPNPASANIEFAISKGETIQLDVYNSLGQSIPVSYTESDNILTINTSGISSGFYIVNIRLQDNTVYTSRFQVIH